MGVNRASRTALPQRTCHRRAIALVAALTTAAAAAARLALPPEAQAQASDLVYDTTLYEGMRYRMIGPHRGGRVTAVAGIAGRPLVYFMGSPGGGVWKTEDAGVSWANAADRYLESASVASVDVSDSDPSVIWIGMAPARHLRPLVRQQAARGGDLDTLPHYRRKLAEHSRRRPTCSNLLPHPGVIRRFLRVVSARLLRETIVR